MSSYPKWLRAAAVICERAKLVNIANTCTQAAAYIDSLEQRLRIPAPELGSDHEQVDCPDPANCPICSPPTVSPSQT